MMTDTEILDYLDESYARHRPQPCDVQIGSVVITLGLRTDSLRERIILGIANDQGGRASKVADKLTAEPDDPDDFR
jgi:hypothetical protein